MTSPDGYSAFTYIGVSEVSTDHLGIFKARSMQSFAITNPLQGNSKNLLALF
ncbi:hypothetical protein Q7L38_26520 [Pseudomonas protegens]|uniref:hypothetical protein n=1 Tax=Pseudomonas protegens TaxID=380021 RepID=UPI002759B7E6|nr:hypothetical protein [Pseudomonas protegens]MDP9536137.1 hypothetical protein [Pseudomonas protegens]